MMLTILYITSCNPESSSSLDKSKNRQNNKAKIREAMDASIPMTVGNVTKEEDNLSDSQTFTLAAKVEDKKPEEKPEEKSGEEYSQELREIVLMKEDIDSNVPRVEKQISLLVSKLFVSPKYLDAFLSLSDTKKKDNETIERFRQSLEELPEKRKLFINSFIDGVNSLNFIEIRKKVIDFATKLQQENFLKETNLREVVSQKDFIELSKDIKKLLEDKKLTNREDMNKALKELEEVINKVASLELLITKLVIPVMQKIIEEKNINGFDEKSFSNMLKSIYTIFIGNEKITDPFSEFNKLLFDDK